MPLSSSIFSGMVARSPARSLLRSYGATHAAARSFGVTPTVFRTAAVAILDQVDDKGVHQTKKKDHFISRHSPGEHDARCARKYSQAVLG